MISRGYSVILCSLLALVLHTAAEGGRRRLKRIRTLVCISILSRFSGHIGTLWRYISWVQ